MDEFAQWSLDALRDEDISLSWLEEQRFDWTKATSLALEQILVGKTVILITDEKHKWFEQYILNSVNGSSLERPPISIISIESIYTHFDSISGGDMLDMLDDMIAQSYKNDYFFWYIGSGDNKRSDIAKRQDNSYFWIFDEELNNAFTLKSYDKYLDIKLLQLFKLFDASLNAAMFGEVDVSS